MLVVAGEAEEIINPEGGGPQDVALQGDAIPVPGSHLQDGLQPHEFHADDAGQAAQAAHRGLVVGDVDGVNMVLDELPLVLDHLTVGTARRPHFAGDGIVTEPPCSCSILLGVVVTFISVSPL